MNSNYETLEMLRHHTTLGINDRIKLQIKLYQAEKTQRLINEVEHCYIGVDFTEIDELEYKLRLKAWNLKIAPLYEKYGRGIDYITFSMNLLALYEKERLEKEEKKKLKRSRKKISK